MKVFTPGGLEVQTGPIHLNSKVSEGIERATGQRRSPFLGLGGYRFRGPFEDSNSIAGVVLSVEVGTSLGGGIGSFVP